MTRADLQLAYLAITKEYINLSELLWCLDIQGGVEKHVPLGAVLAHQGYLSREDLQYLQMLLKTAAPTLGPGGNPFGPTLSQIEAEFTKRLGTLKRGGRFGRYTIDDEVGRGGMGVVLKCREPDGRAVAVKLLVGGGKADVRDIERFKKEAAIMAQLRHPNIVEIYEVGREKGLDFICMEYVDGENLKEIVKQKVLPPIDALRAIRGVAEALSFMHGRGVIHRDLKPANIVIDSKRRPVLMDFGLAAFDKLEGSERRVAIGTPLYQPPEQAEVGGRFGDVSPASDVYGLGATLYHLVAGKPPFLGPDVATIREKVLAETPRPPKQLNPKVPDDVDALVVRCMKKRQEERYRTPKDLIQAIDEILTRAAARGATRRR